MQLRILTGPDGGKTAAYDCARVLVGRDRDCDLRLRDHEVSPQHAILDRLPRGGYVLHDLRSEHGTFVNGQRIDAPVVLEGGEQIRFGGSSIVSLLDDPKGSAWWRAAWVVPAAALLALLVVAGTVAGVVATRGGGGASPGDAARRPVQVADKPTSGGAATAGDQTADGAAADGAGTGVIAFERDGRGGPRVLLMNPDGSGQVTLASHGSEPAFSPDGTRIAYVGAEELGAFVGGPAGLEIAKRSGGAPSRVGGSAIASGAPDWAPDGTTLAAVGADGGIALLDLEGRGSVRLGSGRAASPVWSPDGSRIALAARVGSSKVVVGTIGANGRGARPLATVGPLEDLASVGLDWSPDGSRIALTCASEDADGVTRPDVCVMAADGSDLTALARGPRADFDPVWSSDGSRIAFVSNRDGNDEIYVMDADGTHQRRLTVDPEPDLHPSWGTGAPLPAGEQRVLLVDDFSDPGSGWETFSSDQGASAAYEDGGLVLEMPRGGFVVTSTSGRSWPEGTSPRVTATSRGGSSAVAFGLLCHYVDQENFDLLGITADGRYAISRFTNGKERILTGGGRWARSAAIPARAGPYELEAGCTGRRLTLSVDGTVVAGARSTRAAGQVGVFTETFATGAADVRFDDALVTADPLRRVRALAGR